MGQKVGDSLCLDRHELGPAHLPGRRPYLAGQCVNAYFRDISFRGGRVAGLLVGILIHIFA